MLETPTRVGNVAFEAAAAGSYRRFRRVRGTQTLRDLVAENRLDARDFIYPLFVRHGEGIREEISSMPGQFHLSIDQLEREAEDLKTVGVRAVLLFGLPASKDEVGSEAYDDEGIVQQAVRRLKVVDPSLVVMTDVCLCEYTSHGHCGVLDGEEILNDESVELLARTSVSLARAGADVIAPSDMMDGRVAGIREALDEAGYASLPILAYAAKFASAFYGPFREAADSTPQFGDRRGYQMDPANGRQAMAEIEEDILEGADMIMVKPALPYLDLVRAARERFDLPLAAYNVSGEYAMLKAAVANGWLDERRATLEALLGIKRAGADMIITYHAKEAARWLREG
ncbi:MAG TPA: porphobilinogen synthase [Dehalococcoidia bacterium]|nr:porphobilinogen synthase [Dehalococcoidia bacterium]